MLPREFRLRTAAEFAAVIKAGRRAGTRRLVVHALVGAAPAAPRAGFVVSGKVGNSVVRHRVTRRLRPLVRAQLEALAPGTAIVVRALPTAAVATSVELDADLRSAVASAVRKTAASIPRSSALRVSTPGPTPGSTPPGSTGAADLAPLSAGPAGSPTAGQRTAEPGRATKGGSA